MNQVVHYHIKTSLFDIVVSSLFTVLAKHVENDIHLAVTFHRSSGTEILRI